MIDINNKGCHQLLLFIIVYNIYIYIIIEKAIIIYILYYITNMLLLKYLLQKNIITKSLTYEKKIVSLQS